KGHNDCSPTSPRLMSDSEKSEVERQLAHARAVVEHALDGIVTIDEGGKIETFNRAARRLFGYNVEEVVGRDLSILGIDTLPESGNVTGRTVVGRRHDGAPVSFETSVIDAEIDGRRLRTVFLREPSQALHEESMTANQKRFDAFMAHLPGVAFMKDLHGRYIYVSPNFARHFPPLPGHLTGLRDEDVWPPQTLPRLRASDRTVAETKGVVQTTETVMRDNGVNYWLATKFPILGADGEVETIGGVALDVTDCRRAFDTLRELQRIVPQRERLADVGAITAKILHDFANPLAGLSMQVQLILRRAARDGCQPLSAAIQPLTQVLSEVQRLDTMLQELKEFVRDQRLELRPLSLLSFLQDCVNRWRPTARSHHINLVLESTPELPTVHADGEKLRCVIDNLLRNAIEALDSQAGKITIRTSQPMKESVQISIEDDGPGVPDGLELFRLFETTKPYGTGLGLAIAKQIIQAHGGTIEHHPADPHGSVFLVDLQCGGPHTLPGDMVAPNGH
ncbi:MAG TPA: PAS domain-containing protein, partial [Candidatus Acidoferrales bacterium]|nr:PAS domain-containing protein [Candidatus Acidoferrales bacterium]